MFHRVAMIVTRMSVGDSGGANGDARVLRWWIVLAFAIMNFLADVKPLAAVAAEASRIGLVNRVVHAADLAATTRELAEKIAAGPPLALRLDKQALNRAASTDLAGALEIEAFSQALAVASDDHQEGVAAFFDKRPPKFTGQ
jgi:hypothetical protein